MQLIYSNKAFILSKKDLDQTFWENKIDQVYDVKTFTALDETIAYLIKNHNLQIEQIENVNLACADTQVHYFTLYFFENGTFKIEKLYADLAAGKGKLIYWSDWDFTLQLIAGEYFLWVYIGGHADMCREIKLSPSEIKGVLKHGLKKVNSLVQNLKTLNGSSVYKRAIKENRKIV